MYTPHPTGCVLAGILFLHFSPLHDVRRGMSNNPLYQRYVLLKSSLGKLVLNFSRQYCEVSDVRLQISTFLYLAQWSCLKK
jgi:hypothetical protein